MLSDKETEIDALGFDTYAASLSELIAEEGITPFTIGIFGSWGTGKTSLMRMLKSKLESRYNVKTVWFNAWKFDDEKQIWTALIQTILSQIEPSLKWRIKRKLKELRGRIEWVEVAKYLKDSMVTPKLDINAISKCFKSKQNVESISEFEKEFEEVVDSLDVERLVIFIDDLDRCRIGATVDILETIKLMLNSRKCVYILGLDYDRVRHAVSKKFSRVEKPQELAEDYLDKIIQLYFHIPRRTEEDMRIYLRYLLTLKYVEKERIRDFTRDVRREIHTKKETDTKKDDSEIRKEIDEDFWKILKAYVDRRKEKSLRKKYKILSNLDVAIIEGTEYNPRKLKRFLNIYEMKESLSRGLESEHDLEGLIKCLLLETRFSDFYRGLENNPKLIEKITELHSLNDEQKKKRLEKSEELKKHYSSSILNFLDQMSIKEVNPSHLRIAQTAESRFALGMEEKRTLENLMNENEEFDQGLKFFESLKEEQKVNVIQDLLERSEYTDPHIREKSVKALGALRGDIPDDLTADVVKKFIELTEDQNAGVRNQAKIMLEIR